jgi:hypothetical protein
MTAIRPGMTAHEVVDVLGPPRSTLTDEEFFRGRRFSGPRPHASKVYWLYLGMPPGRETNIVLDNDIVVSATERPYDAGDWGSAGNTWAVPAMAKQRSHVERQPTFAELVRLPGWHRLGEPDVIQFVVDSFATGETPTDLGRTARRFGELDVLLSIGPHLHPQEVRPAYFPDGYLPVLSRFVHDFGIRPGQYDLAHWILGHDPARKPSWSAQLTYVPANRNIITMYPWDLLSPEEQSHGSLSG